MLELPSVTLICVATKDVDKARIAIEQSCKNISYGFVKLLSDVQPVGFPSINNSGWCGIEPFETIDDWNKFIFYELHQYVNTEFCMLIHPDGFVISPESWCKEFLDYDYIGAPWPKPFTTISGEEVRVGNSVGIRSKRLLELPSKLNLEWKSFDGMTNEDTAICVHYRQHFLDAGMTYAPIEIAAKFSHEIPMPETEGIKPFAFHHWTPAERQFPFFRMSDVFAGYVNLDSRTDRRQHMEQELTKAGISAVRFRGLAPHEVDQPEHKLAVMLNRTPGAIGCHYSQVAVMEEAVRQDKHAFVMEDDLVFCDDIQDRLKVIEDFLSEKDWDIFWLGGTYHKEPTWHKSVDGYHTHPDLKMCTCILNKDWEETDNPNIVKTYGCWSTYAYIVNRKRITHILDLLDQNVYRSMGIDWLMILLQPGLNTFAFNPGCVKQFDNQSNIGKGITKFSAFSALGNHWFKQTL